MKYRGISLLLFISQSPFLIGIHTLAEIGSIIGLILLIVFTKNNVDVCVNSKTKIIKWVLSSSVVFSILLCWLFKYLECIPGELNNSCTNILDVWLTFSIISLLGLILYVSIISEKHG